MRGEPISGGVPEKAPAALSPPSLLALAIIACVFAVNIYRAAHQSITADEAFTFDWYIANPFNWILIVFSTNNHVLHSLLCRLSVKALGLSEPTFRLPSLLGGLLYLAFVYKLCRHLFRNQWTFLFAVSALTLNPFIMDYLSVARGYGMALGFFIGALYFVIRFLDDEPRAANATRVSAAAILLALSVSANLILLIPVVALAGTLTLLRLVDRNQADGWKERLSWTIDRVWLPLAVIAALFVAIPLANEQSGSFRPTLYGQDSLRGTTLSLIQRSLFHQYGPYSTEAITANIGRPIEIITRWVVPALLALVFAMLMPVCWRWLRARDVYRLGNLDRAYFLIGAVLAISLGVLVAAYYLAGLLYPIDRTAIYLVPLVTLEWMLLIERLLSQKALSEKALPHLNRAVGLLAGAPVAIAILLFLRGFTTSYYYEWRYDAGTKRIFHLLEGHNQFSGSKQMRLGVDWKLELSFNFYRQMYRAAWLARVTRDPPEAGGFDYYVLLPEDEEATRKLGLRVIYRDPISEQELAVPSKPLALSSRSRSEAE
jgi:hypothetical protein